MYMACRSSTAIRYKQVPIFKLKWRFYLFYIRICFLMGYYKIFKLSPLRHRYINWNISSKKLGFLLQRRIAQLRATENSKHNDDDDDPDPVTAHSHCCLSTFCFCFFFVCVSCWSLWTYSFWSGCTMKYVILNKINHYYIYVCL